MGRIFFFIATNMAILLVINISMRLLGIEPYLNQNGINMGSLLIFAALFGMSGSFISLALSKWTAKKFTGAQVIENPSTAEERWLVETVYRQADQAGIGRPEVAVYQAPEMNAFATGMNKNSALVAVSTGLMQSMTRDEVEAVLGHEVSHVANGDMVTLALIQGVVNTFVIFFSRIIGQMIDRVVFKNERGYGMGYWIGTIVAEIVLSILASIVVRYFSRLREYRADAGGAELAGRQKMIAALERLNQKPGHALPEQLAAFGISGGRIPGGLQKLFMTHPPLEERIAALRNSAEVIQR